MSPNRQKQQRPGVPPELVRDYDIVMKKGNEVINTISIRGNYQRHRVHRFRAVECDSVELNISATNGAENAVVFEVRAY